MIHTLFVGIRWQRANKADYARGALHSRVYIMDKQAEYLRLHGLGASGPLGWQAACFEELPYRGCLDDQAIVLGKIS